jgi:hypothetical protein
MALELDLEKIADSEHLLSLLVSIENVLDSSDAYCFKNWYDGEVVEGPIVRRHWVTIGLLYPYHKMPDPKFALRLLRIGVQVEFDRMQHAQPSKVVNGWVGPDQPEEDHKTPDEWLVRLSFPRRLLDQNDETDLVDYEEDVNPDDVSAAKDSGMDDESPLHSDEQMPGMGGDDQAMMDQQPPGGAPPPPPQ